MQALVSIIINKNQREKKASANRKHAVADGTGQKAQTYLGDSSDHVCNERFERVDSASLLVAAEPNADADEVAGSLLL